ncbi:MAG: DUF5301 domain-containing protein [Peptococcaceae bacterium]
MWCHTLFPIILNMSLTAGIVIILVLLVRLPLRKAPKIFSYALWAVVLFRLLCPVSFSSDLSLVGTFHTPAVTNGNIAYIPADIVHAANPQVDLPLPGVSEVINESLPQSAEQTGAAPPKGPMAIATLLWFGGIAVLLVYSMASLLPLKRKLTGAVLLRENIYLAEHLAMPFVSGVIRPKIYLPSTLSEREREYIILHEQIHIRRFDHIIRLVSFLALTLHWFNPLVWVAFILSGKDMEMSCDEAVLKKLDGDIRADYAASLLSLATDRKIIAGAPLAFGEGDTKSRIKNVMNYKKPAFGAVIAAVIVCIAVAVLLLANPAETPELPEAASVLSLDMEQFNEYESLGAVTVTDSGDMKTVLAALSGARKTLRQSVKDYPARNNYLVVKINLSGERRTLCLYSEGNVYFIEEPYAGIYRSTRDSSVAIYKIYTGSGGVRGENSDDDWQPHPEYENRDDYLDALDAAQKSVKTEEIVVDDMGSNEKTALAWMEAWFYMLKALPGDNMAHISEGAVDHLEVIRVSKERLSKAFVFSVTFSVRPTYPIVSNAFWMAGNTGNSRGRDETWGQMSRQVELRWRDDGKYHFVSMGTGGVGNGDDYEDPSQQAAESWKTIVEADVNRDGLKEAFYHDKSHMDSGPWVTLRLRDGSGNEIWSEDAGIPHTGWNSLFLCEQKDEYYLLRYNPGMWQGYCTYTYSLFTLEGGAEHVIRSNTLEFDINGTAALDAPKMVAFADEVNALLRKSTLLLSSEGGNYSFGPLAADQFLVRYPWLDETPELYADGDDLETRLVKYSEYAVSNHR